MREITLSKSNFRDFFQTSMSQYLQMKIKGMEEDNEEENIEFYFIGVDIEGDLFYTERTAYIPFLETIFIIELEEYIENQDSFETDRDFEYIKELIEARFKKEHDLIVSVKLTD